MEGHGSGVTRTSTQPGGTTDTAPTSLPQLCLYGDSHSTLWGREEHVCFLTQHFPLLTPRPCESHHALPG